MSLSLYTYHVYMVVVIGRAIYERVAYIYIINQFGGFCTEFRNC